jgi:ABC-type phosphate/phosphonate transport system ATPase subunit
MALEYFPRAVGLRTGRVQFDLASSTVNENLLQDLYGNTFQEARRIPNENRFRREFGCR